MILTAIAAGLWITAGTTGDITVAAIAAIASVLNTWLILRAKTSINEKQDTKRIVVTRTDKGILITDEDIHELEER